MIERTLNLKIAGAGARMMMFAHGFGCDQNMWRLVAPAFKGDFRAILFDFVGAGRSDLGAYDVAKYASLLKRFCRIPRTLPMSQPRRARVALSRTLRDQ